MRRSSSSETYIRGFFALVCIVLTIFYSDNIRFHSKTVKCLPQLLEIRYSAKFEFCKQERLLSEKVEGV